MTGTYMKRGLDKRSTMTAACATPA